jgi:hypothetical protein
MSCGVVVAVVEGLHKLNDLRKYICYDRYGNYQFANCADLVLKFNRGFHKNRLALRSVES